MALTKPSNYGLFVFFLNTAVSRKVVPEGSTKAYRQQYQKISIYVGAVCNIHMILAGFVSLAKVVSTKQCYEDARRL